MKSEQKNPYFFSILPESESEPSSYENEKMHAYWIGLINIFLLTASEVKLTSNDVITSLFNFGMAKC